MTSSLSWFHQPTTQQDLSIYARLLVTIYALGFVTSSVVAYKLRQSMKEQNNHLGASLTMRLVRDEVVFILSCIDVFFAMSGFITIMINWQWNGFQEPRNGMVSSSCTWLKGNIHGSKGILALG